jgi:hypothetical protein
MKIIKRDGRQVNFNRSKIETAIRCESCFSNIILNHFESPYQLYLPIP